MTGLEDYEPGDTLAEAWQKHNATHTEVLASWREQNGYWPMDHPNDVWVHHGED